MSTDFLADYVLFNEGNEANRNYHVWSGLTALSCIASRRFWIDFGYFRLYPNLYCVLVGPAGNKKTTAMTSAKGLIREIGTIPFSAECQTKESLVKDWEGCQQQFLIAGTDRPLIYTPYSIFVTELSQFIGVDPARMIDFLTTVYDQDFYDLKTKNKGSQLIVGPYITFLACTTPEWITSYLRLDVITGGFSRRAVFVNEIGNNRRIAFPVITDEQRAAWKRVLDHAHLLLTIGGQFKWNEDAKAFYKHWYDTRTVTKDPMLAGFDSTLYIQVLKVAMLLRLSQGIELNMTLECIKAAMAILDKVMQTLPAVFSGMGRNELNSVRAKVANLLASTGPIPEKKLMGMMYSEANGRDLNDVLATMCDTDQIVRAKQTLKMGDTEVVKFWIALKADATKEKFEAAFKNLARVGVVPP